MIVHTRAQPSQPPWRARQIRAQYHFIWRIRVILQLINQQLPFFRVTDSPRLKGKLYG